MSANPIVAPLPEGSDDESNSQASGSNPSVVVLPLAPGTGSTAVPTSFVSSAAVQPPKPKPKAHLYKMCTVHEHFEGSGTYYGCSGGVPVADWSGLDPSFERSKENPYQQRLTKEDGKQYPYRIKGLETLFKPKDDLYNFQTLV